MAIDSDEVVVGGDGHVFVAPAGTAVPTSMSALPGTWIDVGYISEDGVSFTDGKEIEDIQAWQSFYPIRKIITAKSSALEFIMRQWNGENLKLAFGGGTVNNNAGITTYVPPTPSEFDSRAMVVEWEDGSETYRLVVPKGLVSGDTETAVNRTSATDLPISFAITPDTVPSTLSSPPTAGELITQPWYVLSNATGFVT